DVILFKIDAEGVEDKVLRSAAKLFAKHHVGAVLIETKPSEDSARDRFKREWLEGMLTQGYSAYSFYEEVGRSVYSWGLAEHLFPIQAETSFANWPTDQEFEDHLFVRKPLSLPSQPAVSIPWPPFGHTFGNPARVVLVAASFNLATPEQGWVTLSFSGGADVELKDPKSQTRIGSNYGYSTVVLPELADGEYRVTARVVGSDGVPFDHAVAEDSVRFYVARGSPGLSPAAKWQCERFMHPDSC
ncbi:hypothetical protein T484DRAFT_1776045, partial [Baffinella frigidus]